MVTVMEIVLIIIGIALIAAGYIIPAGGKTLEAGLDHASLQKKIDEAVAKRVADCEPQISSQLEDVTDEKVADAEVRINRITNEKMTAISEYADTVLTDIHKNHDEVVFMYDMLNDKHKSLTGLVSEMTKQADDAKQAVSDAKISAMEISENVANAAEQTSTANVVNEENSFNEIKFENISDNQGEKDRVLEDVVVSEKEPEETVSSNDMILEMHKKGKSNIVIARELGLGVGEVGLVIDLSKKQKKVK